MRDRVHGLRARSLLRVALRAAFTLALAVATSTPLAADRTPDFSDAVRDAVRDSTRPALAWFGGLNDGRITALALHLRWREPAPLPWSNSGRWTWYPEAQVQGWATRREDGSSSGTAVAGAIGFVRWQPHAGASWFIDAGLGGFLVADRSALSARPTGGNFLFSEQVGIGWRIGDSGVRRGWELRVGLAHFSNARIDPPNPGYDFIQVQLSGRL